MGPFWKGPFSARLNEHITSRSCTFPALICSSFEKRYPKISLIVCEPIGRLNVGSIEFVLGWSARRGLADGDACTLRAGHLGLGRRGKRLFDCARPTGRLPASGPEMSITMRHSLARPVMR
jgi:hypothetical protein